MYDTIYLHAGLPKTGSTHVQNGLQHLSMEGLLGRVAYPVVSPELGSGNGAIVSALLRSAEVDADVEARLEACLHELLAAAQGQSPDLLISSEHFFFATVEALSAFRRMLLRHARTVKLVVCVRPLRDWTWSLYMQMVKAHLLSDDFDVAWLARWGDTWLPNFANLDRFDAEAIAFPYRDRGLLADLLAAIGEDEGLARHFPEGRVNRSLGATELGIVRKVNAAFADEVLSRAISDHYTITWPEDPTAAFPAACEADFRGFAAAFEDRLEPLQGATMRAVKELLFADAPLAANARDKAGHDDRDLLGIALSEIRRHQDFYRLDGQQCHAMKREAQALEPTRDFFDPIHYLLMYPDLCIPEIDPELHYRNHGREEGRASGLKGKHTKRS
ncbi:MAG TPA: hypothetical protein VGH80_08290 [Xanthomonadaceae bacterium]